MGKSSKDHHVIEYIRKCNTSNSESKGICFVNEMKHVAANVPTLHKLESAHVTVLSRAKNQKQLAKR